MNFSQREKENRAIPTNKYPTNPKDHTESADLPEVYNTYSDLNLFLSQKIKQEMQEKAQCKKWSFKLQEELINKIKPEFQKRFPRYRLATSSLRKIWEKLTYYTTLMQKEKEALTEDGKVNIPFFIRENLKQCAHFKSTFKLPPYHFAHHIAAKMGECIATIDGVRPEMDQLTRTIWSMQKHLITDLFLHQVKSPYDDCEALDKLIVKTILFTTSCTPHLSQKDLEVRVRETLNNYSSCCLEYEMATLLIDSPHENDSKLVEISALSLQKAADLIAQTKESELKKKIYLWTIQAEMIYRSVRLNEESPLFKLLLERWNEDESLEQLRTKVCEGYLALYPQCAKYAEQLHLRCTMCIKYCWYTRFSKENESSFERFLSWQLFEFPALHEEELEKIIMERLPLMPFDRLRCRTLAASVKEKTYSQSN